MSRIEAAFRQAGEQGRAAFVPYITAGDPSPERTASLVLALERAGADVVELGVPFSDPLADGPVNQRAAQRALAAGTTLQGVLGMVAAIRKDTSVPLVLFTYFNPLHRMGLDRFAAAAAAGGVDGVLVTDLAVDEAADYLAPMRRAQVDTIFLAAPTSGPERAARVSRESRGFLYYISRTGVTGDPEDLSVTLEDEVQQIRQRVALPVAVGFGISTPEQVRQVAQVADGVVVGSALVAHIEKHGVAEDLPARLQQFACTLAAATRREVR